MFPKSKKKEKEIPVENTKYESKTNMSCDFQIHYFIQ